LDKGKALRFLRGLLPLKEGLPLLLVFGGGGVISLYLGFWRLGVLLFGLFAFFLFFFRNPQRIPPEGEGLILSPADGKVIRIEEGVFPLFGEGKLISIFMSLLDVHVNRSPLDCTVKRTKHQGGRFLPAYKEEAPLQNERNLLFLQSPEGKPFLLVQVAGILARRILCRVKPGQNLKRGEILGAILFGSRVDLYVPKEVKLLVSLGEKVKAGESIIGVLKGEGR
jgi:phosphatidylserine decarboxylase